MDVSAPPIPLAVPPKLAEPPKTDASKAEDNPKVAAQNKPGSKTPAPKAKVDSKVQQPPKDDNNVTAAIVATVFIVFGLAALATYAYFKQNV